MATNTKIIKLTNGTITYVPVTVAAAVQYDYGTNSYTSVQEAIGITAGSVNDHITTGISLTKAANSSNISLSGAHNATGSVSIEGGAYISIDNTTADKFVISGYNIAKNDHNHQIGFTGDYIELDPTNLSTSLVPTVKRSKNLEGGNSKQIAYQTAANTTGFITAPSTSGQFLKYNGTNIVWAADNDTKNTVGSNQDTGKLFLVGTKNQSTNSGSYQGYSNSSTYIWNGVTYSTTFKGDLNGTINTATTATTQTAGDNSTKVATTAFVKTAVDNALTNLNGALKYKGVVNSNTDLPSATVDTVGYVYVVKTGGNYTVDHDANGTATSNKLESGDYIIGSYVGSSYVWIPINGENQVSDGTDKAVIKADGTEGTATIATVDGTDITLSYSHGTPSGGTDTTKSASGSGTATSVTTTSYIPVVSAVTIKKDNNGHITDFGVTTTGLKISYIDNNSAKAKFASKNGKIVYTYISPSGNSDTTNGSTIQFAEGNNITITRDSDTKITISSSYSDTHYLSKNIVGASNGTADSSQTTNGNVYLRHLEWDGSSYTPTSTHKISGSTGIKVTSDGSGNISIAHTHTDISAQSTEALYKIKYDAQGHITGGSSATIKVTPHNSGLKVKIGPDTTNDFGLFADSQFTQTISLADLTQVTAVVS